MCDRTSRSLRPVLLAVVAGFAIIGASGLVPSPASAEAVVQPRAAALSVSASCTQGDIEITYGATGVDRQLTQFTAEDGRTLHSYDVRVYSSTHDGTEFILSQTTQAVAAGTIVAVHTTIGSSPPDSKTAEFYVAYRCDLKPNDQGGKNVVVASCAGMYGTCPSTAQQPAGAQPVAAVPRFTG